MQLDAGTLFAATAFFLLLIGLMDLAVWWTRRTYPGFGRWTVGNLAFVLSLLLVSSRAFAPDWVSVIFGNAGLFIAAILYLEGARIVRGWTPHSWPVVAGAAVTILVIGYFNYDAPNLNARICASSLFLAIVFAVSCAALLQHRNEPLTLGTVITSTLFAFCSLLLILRCVYFYFAPPYTNIFAPTAINNFFLFSIALALSGCALGFILMMDEFATNDLTGAQRRLAEANRELLEALKNAEANAERAAKADAAKTEFVAVMSHEIRNPLGAIIATAELLLETGLTAEQKMYADAIDKSANRLLALADDGLDLSTIEAGRFTIDSYKFDLFKAVRDIIQIFAPLANDKGVDLLLDYPDSTPRRFIGDAGRIRQVVTNLVSNALKFTSAGHVNVSVTCESVDGKSARVKVAVSDSGIGIFPDRVGALFQMFVDAGKSASGNHRGSGIGLAISKKLVELMGGSIHVESERDKGSKFWFELPLQIAVDKDSAARTNSTGA